MNVFRSGDRLLEKSIIILGMFDGMHLGHMTLVEKAVSLKRKLGLPAVMYTFDVNPKSDKKRLMSNDKKVKMCESRGLDGIYFETFSEAFRKMPPGEFITKILLGTLGAQAVVVGDDYRFGCMGKGEPRDLLGHGFDVFVMPQLQIGGCAVSSSGLRMLIENCEIQKANMLLGYTYSLSGTVVHGRGVGRQFGVHTANVDTDPSFVIPGDGVYITKIIINEIGYPSLTNIGVKPTFSLDFRTVEVHIPDFSGDLYGQEILIEFVEYLRPEIAFSSVDELKAQIINDINVLRSKTL